MIFSAIMFFAPELGGYFLEYNNFIPADPLKTPAHIAPVWYFTPYYSMLRATTDLMVNVLAGIVAVGARAGDPEAAASARRQDRRRWSRAVVAIALLKTFDAKFWGVVVMGGAVHHPVLPALARPQPGALDPLPAGLAQVVYGVFVVFFLVLGYLGIAAAVGPSAHYVVADRHPVLLRLLPADAVVEPASAVQAGARPRDLRRPLSDRAAPR